MTVQRPLACVILAAGKGTRMKSALPKVMHKLAGRPMINYVLETAESLNPEKIVVVVAPDMEDVKEAVQPHTTVVQQRPLGTADAVKAALPVLAGFEGDILVLYGDGPLYKLRTLKNLLNALHEKNASMAWLAMTLDDPSGYGRLICDKAGNLKKIVEEKDASDEERSIRLCWAGIMCGSFQKISAWLEQIDNNNAKSEYYLTSLPIIAAVSGDVSVVYESPLEETLGANTRVELSILERKIQERLRVAAMENGATLLDPDTVYLSYDTILGRDVVIEPNVFIGTGVRIEDGALIRSFSHIEEAVIRERAQIGPFARIRPKSDIGRDVRVGNFSEINRSTLKDGATCKHLSYLGDATVHENANIGAGTVVANYDGAKKSKTVIGRGAFTGSNSTLIAPLTIGDNAYIAAGSTIDEDVPPEALAIARERVTIKKERAKGRTKKHG